MDKKRFRQSLRRALWIPFGVGIIFAAILILEVRFLTEQAAWVEHTDQVITVSQRIYRSRIDQESGLRAYVLTGDKRFLDIFYKGQAQALAMEPELRQLVSKDPEQTARNEESYRAAQVWSSWADRAIAMTETGDDAGNMAFQLRGKELMDSYRSVRTALIDRERELRDERLARSRGTLKIVNASIVALAALFALGFALLGRRQLTSLSESLA